MTWLFGASFDYYDTTGAGRDGWVLDGASIISTGGRRNGGRLSVPSAATADKSFGGNQTELFVGFGVSPSSTPTTRAILSFMDGTTAQYTLVMMAGGALALYRGSRTGTQIAVSSTASLTAGAYRHIEVGIVMNGSTGSVEVRVDGVTVADLTQASPHDTTTTANNYATGIRFGEGGSVTSTLSIDDLTVCNGSGLLCNDFLGDVKAQIKLPNGAGTYQQFTPSTGSDHDALVDEVPQDSTDYNFSSTLGHKETYTLSALSGLVGIVAVQLNNYVHKSDAGLAIAQNLIKSGTTELNGPDFAASTSSFYSTTAYETDPDTSAAWVQAGVDALEAGVENNTT